ncbi:MAG: (Fe-S)-binding protein, partial [Myxococcales bacterium]|nr:(Fe-S)-binding protein [Myxococcales bacterium]
MEPTLMALLLVVTLGGFAWSATRRIRQLRVGAPDPHFTLSGGEWWRRLWDVVDYALLQRRMTDPRSRYRAAGIGHALIFWGFSVLALRTLMLWARGFDADFDFWGLFAMDAPLGMAYGFAKDTFVLLVLAGVAVFFVLRARRTPRMTLSGEAYLILGIIATMMVADLIYDGAWFLLQARQAGVPFAFHPAEYAGSTLASLFDAMDLESGTLVVLSHVGFWTHSSLVLIFLNILPFSKHFHVITVLPNVYTRDRTPPGTLPKVDDIEG